MDYRNGQAACPILIEKQCNRLHWNLQTIQLLRGEHLTDGFVGVDSADRLGQ